MIGPREQWIELDRFEIGFLGGPLSLFPRIFPAKLPDVTKSMAWLSHTRGSGEDTRRRAAAARMKRTLCEKGDGSTMGRMPAEARQLAPLRHCRQRPLAPAGAQRRRRRRPRGALLAGALLAHCAAVAHAGTPNAWSTVALSGMCRGG